MAGFKIECSGYNVCYRRHDRNLYTLSSYFMQSLVVYNVGNIYIDRNTVSYKIVVLYPVSSLLAPVIYIYLLLLFDDKEVCFPMSYCVLGTGESLHGCQPVT